MEPEPHLNNFRSTILFDGIIQENMCPKSGEAVFLKLQVRNLNAEDWGSHLCHSFSLPLDALFQHGGIGSLITADSHREGVQGLLFTEVPLQGSLLHLPGVLVVRPVGVRRLAVGQARTLGQVACVLCLLPVHAAQVVQQVRLSGLGPGLQAETGSE